MKENPRDIPWDIVRELLPGLLTEREPDIEQKVAQEEVAQDEVSSIDMTPPLEGCKHHWKIPTPDGQTSKGVCKNCGGERIFKNYATRAPYRNHRL